MSASKRQGIIAIGVCCILVSVLLVFYGISQPKVNETPLSQLQDTLSQTSIKTSSSDKNDASFKNSDADTQTTVLNTKYSQPSSAQSVSYPVNLNTCTYEDLVSIDGIQMFLNLRKLRVSGTLLLQRLSRMLQYD